MDKLLSTVQRKGESIRNYIEQFRNLSLMCPAGMPLPMLLQTCRHNFLDQVEIRMGAVKAHTWKELVEQAEIAKKSAKKFEPSTPKGKWAMNNKGRGDMAQSSQAKGKETMSVELSGTFIRRPRKAASIIRSLSFLRNNTTSKTSRWSQYFIYSTKGRNWAAGRSAP